MFQKKYRLEKILGEGTYGKVYAARNTTTGKAVAVKIVKNEREILKDKRIRYVGTYSLTEIDVMSRISHPNLMKYFEFFIDLQLPGLIFVMPYADNTLQRYISPKTTYDNRVRLIYELLSGLIALHEGGYYHCDLKAENIFIINDRLIIGDFGLATQIDSESTTCVTIHYASPEEILKKYDVAEKIFNKSPYYRKWFEGFSLKTTEIWSLGVLIYFILKGKELFYLPGMSDEQIIQAVYNFTLNPSEKISQVFVPWQSLLLSILQPDPNLRTKTLSEMMNFEVFEKKNYGKPISGEVKNERIYLVPEDGEDAEMISDARDFLQKQCIEADFLSKTYFVALDIYYRSYKLLIDEVIRDKGKKGLYLIPLAALIMSSKLYEGGATLISDLTVKRSEEDAAYVEILELRIIEILGGGIFPKNVYEEVFSLRSLMDTYFYINDEKSYTTSNHKDYVKVLMNNETIDESLHRESKEVSFAYLWDYILSHDLL